jgi:hypothetical protein
LVTSEVLLVQAVSATARAAAVITANGAEAIRMGMNLTFPMALDYRRFNKARAPWPPECVAVNQAYWQADIGSADDACV